MLEIYFLALLLVIHFLDEIIVENSRIIFEKRVMTVIKLTGDDLNKLLIIHNYSLQG